MQKLRGGRSIKRSSIAQSIPVFLNCCLEKEPMTPGRGVGVTWHKSGQAKFLNERTMADGGMEAGVSLASKRTHNVESILSGECYVGNRD